MSKLNISLILAIVVLLAIVVSGAEIRIKIGSDDSDGVELNQSLTLVRNQPESEAIQQIASSGADIPVLMMNLNKYKTEAEYPNGSLYKDYMSKLDELLSQTGARVLWRTNVEDRMVGTQDIDEIIAIWYPSHSSFLQLRSLPAGDENFRLRGLAVENAVVHRTIDYPNIDSLD